MIDHLPECPFPLCDSGEPDADCMGYEDCLHVCCCTALRACEQRARQDERAAALYAAREAVAALDYGYNAGVQAARDAVAGVPSIDQRVDENGLIRLVYDKGEILDAIDALRGER